MRYLSVCSGIEAATVAWRPLGWEAAAFSEIERFPRAVLEHHYPDVPLHGDFTTIKGDEYGAVDVLVGGTPCQSFSVAGLRKGMDDARGGLALEFLRLARRTRARWVVWENVPGALSSNGGRDFGSFLGGLEELGYGVAYRVMDAQHAGVPQRRRRVFVVGYLGDWRRAAAVLFERESMSGHPPPSREAGKGSAARPGDGVESGDVVTMSGEDIAPSFIARMASATGGTQDAAIIAHTLRAEGFDASEDGTGREPTTIYGDPIAPTLIASNGRGPTGTTQDAHVLALPFDTTQVTSKLNRSNPKPGDPCHPLAAGAHPPAVAFGTYNQSLSRTAHTLRDPNGTFGDALPAISQSMAVRRITPTEAERLQGFPDSYTKVPYRGKPAEDCPDGPRYKALGNSFAVPVMRWIGSRISTVEALK